MHLYIKKLLFLSVLSIELLLLQHQLLLSLPVFFLLFFFNILFLFVVFFPLFFKHLNDLDPAALPDGTLTFIANFSLVVSRRQKDEKQNSQVLQF